MNDDSDDSTIIIKYLFLVDFIYYIEIKIEPRNKIKRSDIHFSISLFDMN